MGIQETFEAISDPNRRTILELLKTKGRSVGELAEHLEITGASLSHHLNKLKSAGLITSKRNGQSIIYSIHTSVFEDAASAVASLFKIRRNS